MVCYGLIMKWNDRIMLVMKSDGFCSFPKGSFEPKVDADVTACMKREWIEETGMVNFQYKYDPELVIEKKYNGNISCSYYLALIEDPNQNFEEVGIRQGDEITSCKWFTRDEIVNLPTNKFLFKRKTLALNYLDSTNYTNFTHSEYMSSNPPVNSGNLQKSSNNSVAGETGNFVKGVYMEKTKRVGISKACTRLLRHNLDKFRSARTDGTVEIRELMSKLECRISRRELEYVVENCEKKRMFIEGDRIGCAQGHSSGEINEDEIFEEIIEPLTGCFHMTDSKALISILAGGLKIMGRKHMHFAQDEHLLRKGKKVRLALDMNRAMQAGIKFYRSKNNVILTTGIQGTLPPQFLKTIL